MRRPTATYRDSFTGKTIKLEGPDAVNPDRARVLAFQALVDSGYIDPNSVSPNALRLEQIGGDGPQYLYPSGIPGQAPPPPRVSPNSSMFGTLLGGTSSPGLGTLGPQQIQVESPLSPARPLLPSFVTGQEKDYLASSYPINSIPLTVQAINSRQPRETMLEFAGATGFLPPPGGAFDPFTAPYTPQFKQDPLPPLSMGGPMDYISGLTTDARAFGNLAMRDPGTAFVNLAGAGIRGFENMDPLRRVALGVASPGLMPLLVGPPLMQALGLKTPGQVMPQYQDYSPEATQAALDVYNTTPQTQLGASGRATSRGIVRTALALPATMAAGKVGRSVGAGVGAFAGPEGIPVGAVIGEGIASFAAPFLPGFQDKISEVEEGLRNTLYGGYSPVRSALSRSEALDQAQAGGAVTVGNVLSNLPFARPSLGRFGLQGRLLTSLRSPAALSALRSELGEELFRDVVLDTAMQAGQAGTNVARNIGTNRPLGESLTELAGDLLFNHSTPITRGVDRVLAPLGDLPVLTRSYAPGRSPTDSPWTLRDGPSRDDSSQDTRQRPAPGALEPLRGLEVEATSPPTRYTTDGRPVEVMGLTEDGRLGVRVEGEDTVHRVSLEQYIHTTREAPTSSDQSTPTVARPRQLPEMERSFREQFGLSDADAAGVAGVYDAAFREEARRSGRPVEDIYAERVDAIQRGGEALAIEMYRARGTSDSEIAQMVADGKLPRGAIDFDQNGRAVISALANPDATSGLHELGHLLRRMLTPAEQARVGDHYGATQESDGTWTWPVAAEEHFARDVEAVEGALYQRRQDRVAADATLQGPLAAILRKVRNAFRWIGDKLEVAFPRLREIYGVDGKTVVNPHTVRLLNERFGRGSGLVGGDAWGEALRSPEHVGVEDILPGASATSTTRETAEIPQVSQETSPRETAQVAPNEFATIRLGKSLDQLTLAQVNDVIAYLEQRIHRQQNSSGVVLDTMQRGQQQDLAKLRARQTELARTAPDASAPSGARGPIAGGDPALSLNAAQQAEWEQATAQYQQERAAAQEITDNATRQRELEAADARYAQRKQQIAFTAERSPFSMDPNEEQAADSPLFQRSRAQSSRAHTFSGLLPPLVRARRQLKASRVAGGILPDFSFAPAAVAQTTPITTADFQNTPQWLQTLKPSRDKLRFRQSDATALNQGIAQNGWAAQLIGYSGARATPYEPRNPSSPLWQAQPGERNPLEMYGGVGFPYAPGKYGRFAGASTLQTAQQHARMAGHTDARGLIHDRETLQMPAAAQLRRQRDRRIQLIFRFPDHNVLGEDGMARNAVIEIEDMLRSGQLSIPRPDLDRIVKAVATWNDMPGINTWADVYNDLRQTLRNQAPTHFTSQDRKRHFLLDIWTNPDLQSHGLTPDILAEILEGGSDGLALNTGDIMAMSVIDPSLPASLYNTVGLSDYDTYDGVIPGLGLGLTNPQNLITLFASQFRPGVTRVSDVQYYLRSNPRFRIGPTEINQLYFQGAPEGARSDGQTQRTDGRGVGHGDEIASQVSQSERRGVRGDVGRLLPGAGAATRAIRAGGRLLEDDRRDRDLPRNVDADNSPTGERRSGRSQPAVGQRIRAVDPGKPAPASARMPTIGRDQLKQRAVIRQVEKRMSRIPERLRTEETRQRLTTQWNQALRNTPVARLREMVQE